MQINIASIETLGALDGPGLRTIFFFKGCPLRCKYCHNADMFLSTGGTSMSIEELVAEANKYKVYYGNEGGVTLGGGEPLAQQNGALALIRALQHEGIHVCLDTSGVPYSEEILNEVDLTILDFKHTEPVEFLELTKYKIDDTLKTLQFLKTNKKRFWVRQVIVEGITDSDEQVLRLKELAAGAEKIELLAYHKMGVDKWKAAGFDYALDHVPATSKDTMDRVRALL